MFSTLRHYIAKEFPGWVPKEQSILGKLPKKVHSSVTYCTAAQLEEVNKPRNASHETVSSTVRSSHDSRDRLPEDKNKRKLQIAIQQVVAVAYQL